MSMRLCDCLLVGVLAFAACVPSVALADAPEDPAALKAEGDKLMESYKYSDALERYERAYKVSHDPALLYNAGRALELMGRFPEAFDKLTLFASSASPTLLARVPNLAKLVSDVEQKTCLLTIDVKQKGATVRLGQTILGPSPIGSRRVNAGSSASVVADLEGYEQATKVIDLPGKGDVHVTLDLVPKDKTATLRVTSPVAGARITVDGKDAGQVPAEIRLPPGTHQVHLDATGYRDNTVEVVLGAADRRTIAIEPGDVPVYETWWFWTITGTVVAGGAAAVGVYAATTEGAPDVGTIAPCTAPVGLHAQADTCVGGAMNASGAPWKLERSDRSSTSPRAFQIGPVPVLKLHF